MDEKKYYSAEYWFNKDEHKCWDNGGENYYVNKFYQEIIFKLNIPKEGYIVILGTHNCVSFDKLCKFFGYDRVKGYDLHNPTNHPNVIIKDCNSLSEEDNLPIAFLHNDLGSFSTTPNLKLHGYQWGLKNIIEGGYVLGNNNLNRAKIKIENIISENNFENIYLENLNKTKFNLDSLSKKEIHNGREFSALDGYMLSKKLPYINISFLCNWGESSNQLMKKYSKLKSANFNNWKNLFPIDNINNSDWVIVMDDYSDIDKLKNKNIIVLPREPYKKNKNISNINVTHDLNYNNFYHVWTCIAHIEKNYDELMLLNLSKKTHKCSAVVSKLIHTTPNEARIAYEERVAFIKKLSTLKTNDIDIYGYNWKKSELGEMYKGTLGGFNMGTAKVIDKLIPNTTKLDGILPYKYTIAIENCVKNNYFSEKFTDAVLGWSIPIYYGCPNINEYFPKDSYYAIDIKNENCLQQIEEIINRPITEENIKALKKARELILNKYNLWESIHSIINKNDPLKSYSIYRSDKYNDGKPKEPFHNDNNMLKITLDNLNNSYNFIETGSYMGKTIYFVGKNFPNINCYSCEVNKSYYDIALEQVRNLSNVTYKLQKSPNFLYDLVKYDKNIYNNKSFFWLDAHWGSNPIYEELNFITKTFKKFFIIVDDFKIPYDSGFTNDGYSVEKIKPYIHDIKNLTFYMPSYLSNDECCNNNPVGYLIITNCNINTFNYLKNVKDLFL